MSYTKLEKLNKQRNHISLETCDWYIKHKKKIIQNDIDAYEIVRKKKSIIRNDKKRRVNNKKIMKERMSIITAIKISIISKQSFLKCISQR